MLAVTKQMQQEIPHKNLNVVDLANCRKRNSQESLMSKQKKQNKKICKNQNASHKIYNHPTFIQVCFNKSFLRLAFH